MGGVVLLLLGWGMVLLMVGCSVVLSFLLGMFAKHPPVPCPSCGGWDLDRRGKCRRCDPQKTHGFEVITDQSEPVARNPSR